MPRTTSLRFACVVLATSITLALGACADQAVAPAADVQQADAFDRRGDREVQAKCDADNGGLALPPGFCAVVVVKDVGVARHMAARVRRVA